MKKIVLLCCLTVVTTFAAFTQEKNNEDKPLKPALLELDVQNHFVNYMDQEFLDSRYAYINYAIKLFRDANVPVIRIYHTTPGQGPEEGTEAFEFVDKIKIKEEDPKFVKNHGNAFKETGLDKMLKEKEVNTVFVVGLSGTGCVLATYFGGKNLNYDTHLIKGCTISPKAKYTEVVEESQGALSLKAMSLLLKHALQNE